MVFLAYVVKEILILRPFGPHKNFGKLKPPLNIKIFQKYYTCGVIVRIGPLCKGQSKKIQKYAKYGAPY